MRSLNLAPLAPFSSPPAPGATSTNPGCTDPASQSFAPTPTDQASSRTPCKCPTITSDGEIQLANQHLGNTASGTVTVSAGSGAVVQASGEGGQRLDRRTMARAVTTGHGLPVNILAGNESHSRFIAPKIADCMPPAIDVSAGSGRPGGLATNVNIK